MDLELGDTRLIIETCRRYALLRNQAAYVLATAYWETARTMKPVQEAFWMSEDWRKNNLRYYPWHGRGHVQVTWQKNYLRVKTETGVDVVADPDLLLNDPALSAVALVAGCHNGWWTGKKLSDYITLKASDYVGARRVVNGTDKAHAIAEIAREYEAALLREGYGVEKPAPVVNERRDGTPPRESVSGSTTIRAQIAQWLAANGAGVWAIWNSTDDVTKYVIGGLMIAATLAGAWIFKERIRKWVDGDR